MSPEDRKACEASPWAYAAAAVILVPVMVAVFSAAAICLLLAWPFIPFILLMRGFYTLGEETIPLQVVEIERAEEWKDISEIDYSKDQHILVTGADGTLRPRRWIPGPGMGGTGGHFVYPGTSAARDIDDATHFLLLPSTPQKEVP